MTPVIVSINLALRVNHRGRGVTFNFSRQMATNKAAVVESAAPAVQNARSNLRPRSQSCMIHRHFRSHQAFVVRV
jgi:hypothetical protein